MRSLPVLLFVQAQQLMGDASFSGGYGEKAVRGKQQRQDGFIFISGRGKRRLRTDAAAGEIQYR